MTEELKRKLCEALRNALPGLIDNPFYSPPKLTEKDNLSPDTRGWRLQYLEELKSKTETSWRQEYNEYLLLEKQYASRSKIRIEEETVRRENDLSELEALELPPLLEPLRDRVRECLSYDVVGPYKAYEISFELWKRTQLEDVEEELRDLQKQIDEENKYYEEREKYIEALVSVIGPLPEGV